MTAIHSLILGIIEGFSEFLPISSTGHLILASELLKIPVSSFSKSFDIVIQFGAILAAAVVYRRRLLDLDLWKKLLTAFIPTGLIGLVLYKVVKTHLLGNSSVVVWSLFLGGFALIIFELARKKQAGTPTNEETIKTSIVTYKQAVLIGFCQAVAIIPGVSRSAATIVGGLTMGLSRQIIVEFSFLLAIPTMAAASVFDLIKNYESFSMHNMGSLSIGFIASFLVALASIRFLLKYIRQHDFTIFGIYRIILALVFFLVLF